jgi:RNase adaptor protein for sRNA GlmZ degradation
MKLNPKKCSFGMEVGQFLGVMVTKEGFKANPDKVRAVIEMPSPSTLKEVRSLNGRLAALNRFLARHAERSIAFISTMRKCLTKSSFQWTPEAE